MHFWSNVEKTTSHINEILTFVNGRSSRKGVPVNVTAPEPQMLARGANINHTNDELTFQ